MSEAAAAVSTDAKVAPAGKKKLLVLIVAVVLVLAVAAGAMLLLKKKAPVDADDPDGEVAVAQPAPARAGPTNPPTFLTLDPFIVNLGDRDADRYAQIGIILEVESQEFSEKMRAYMPAIRNAILMIIAHKTSRELLERKGKERLAEEVMRETVRPMGIDIPEPVRAKAKVVEAVEDDEAEAPKPEPRKRAGVRNPVRRVHFSSFIIQ